MREWVSDVCLCRCSPFIRFLLWLRVDLELNRQCIDLRSWSKSDTVCVSECVWVMFVFPWVHLEFSHSRTPLLLVCDPSFVHSFLIHLLDFGFVFSLSRLLILLLFSFLFLFLLLLLHFCLFLFSILFACICFSQFSVTFLWGRAQWYVPSFLSSFLPSCLHSCPLISLLASLFPGIASVCLFSIYMYLM